MTVGPLLFTAVVWGAVAAVLAAFAYVFVTLVRKARATTNPRGDRR